MDSGGNRIVVEVARDNTSRIATQDKLNERVGDLRKEAERDSNADESFSSSVENRTTKSGESDREEYQPTGDICDLTNKADDAATSPVGEAPPGRTAGAVSRTSSSAQGAKSSFGRGGIFLRSFFLFGTCGSTAVLLFNLCGPPKLNIFAESPSQDQRIIQDTDETELSMKLVATLTLWEKANAPGTNQAGKVVVRNKESGAGCWREVTTQRNVERTTRGWPVLAQSSWNPRQSV